MSRRYNELVIQTPEGVQFVHPLASPVARLLALAVDLSIISALMSGLSVLVFLMQWVSADLAGAFSVLLYFALNIGYFIVMETVWRGQTVGKRMLRLRVLDAHGLKLQSSQLILRNLLRFVDSLPVLYFVGGSCALLNPRSQRLGDLAAGTVVVRIAEIQPPVLSEANETMYNSFREHPRLEAQLRQRVVPEESQIAVQALRRREEMDPAARAQLFHALAESFKEQAAFPESTTASMSDEHYVRNCVDTIYRGAK